MSDFKVGQAVSWIHVFAADNERRETVRKGAILSFNQDSAWIRMFDGRLVVQSLKDLSPLPDSPSKPTSN